MRVAPQVVKRLDSPNQSSRGGIRPRLIVVHSTESDNRPGDGDLMGVASWLCSPAAQASSHVIVDADGHSVRLVQDSEKAWAQAYWNPWALSIEQVGRAGMTHWARDEIREAARWMALWNRRFGIPLRKAEVNLSTGSVVRSGVIRHSELGKMGGDHHDPGSTYPLADTLALARFYKGRL